MSMATPGSLAVGAGRPPARMLPLRGSRAASFALLGCSSFRMRRRLALALCLLACSLFATTASGAAAGTPLRPQPPTSAEVDRATERFLDSHGEGNDRRASEARGTGGAGQVGDDTLFPEKRIVAFYGAPQMGATILGRRSIGAATRQLRKQTRPYDAAERPAIPGVNLVATIATADRGGDGKYRSRQSNDVIGEYLAVAREGDGRLILDIQSGRSTFLKEVRAFREWIAEPDVDVALDPEWNVGRRGTPGRTTGSVTAEKLNRVSAYLSGVVEGEGLPPKALIVHQFRGGSVKKRRRVEQPEGVDVTLNFDGIGSRAAKKAGYDRLRQDGLFNGFSLFYRLDSGLMSPSQVLGLEPAPDYV